MGVEDGRSASVCNPGIFDGGESTQVVRCILMPDAGHPFTTGLAPRYTLDPTFIAGSGVPLVLIILTTIDKSQVTYPVVIPDTVDMINLLTVRDGTMNVLPYEPMDESQHSINSCLSVPVTRIPSRAFADSPIRHDLLNQPLIGVNDDL